MKDLSQKYSEEVENLITKFESLQEERAQTYHTFKNGNKEYLNSAPEYDFITFRQTVNSVSEDFKRLSEEIIIIEKDLRQRNAENLADFIMQLQELEKQKLELTVEHLLSRQMVQDCSSEATINIERDLRVKLGKIIENINDILSEIRYAVYDT